jgi:hypothetical protein
VRERGALQLGVDLLDDRVAAVGLVRGHGVDHFGVAGGEERMEPPGIEQGRLAVSGVRLRSGMRRTTSRPGTRTLLFCVANAVNGISATSAREIHRPVVLSKTASVYSMCAPRILADGEIAVLIAGNCRTITDTSAPARTAAPTVT